MTELKMSELKEEKNRINSIQKVILSSLKQYEKDFSPMEFLLALEGAKIAYLILTIDTLNKKI